MINAARAYILSTEKEISTLGLDADTNIIDNAIEIAINQGKFRVEIPVYTKEQLQKRTDLDLRRPHLQVELNRDSDGELLRLSADKRGQAIESYYRMLGFNVDFDEESVQHINKQSTKDDDTEDDDTEDDDDYDEYDEDLFNSAEVLTIEWDCSSVETAAIDEELRAMKRGL